MAKQGKSTSKANRWPLMIGVIGAATAIVATLLVTTFGQASGEPLTTISVQQLHDDNSNGDIVLLDVREPWEYEQGHVENAVLMPLIYGTAQLAVDAGLNKDEPVYVFCRSGNRSMQASRALVDAGFTDVRNVDGGVIAWTEAGLPLVR
jgi:rhodanese-related sulfurtransferase